MWCPQSFRKKGGLQWQFYLANTTAVFQAEVTALKKSAEMFVGAGWTHQRTHQMTKQCPFILTKLFIIYT